MVHKCLFKILYIAKYYYSYIATTVSLKVQFCHLNVDKKLPEVAWRHHDGGVQLDNVAFVQGDVMVGSQSLRGKNIVYSKPSALRLSSF